MEEYEVFIETMTGQRIGQLPFETLDLTLRFNEPGRGRVVIPTSLFPNMDVFDTLYRLLIRRNGVNLMSGPILSIERNWSEQDDLLNISIADDLYLLSTRLIVPVPSGPPYTSADHDVRAGAIETVMHQYVYYHAGAGAKTERKINGLTQAADQGRGATVTARGRFVPLLSMLQNLALLGGFGIRVVGLQFQVFQPADKTSTAIFSREMNNLIQFARVCSAPAGNYVYVGGGGEGTSRVIIESGNSTSITRWGRIEAWKDQRNTSDTTELNQSASQYLTEQSEKEQRIQFSANASLDNVGVGDIVSIVFDGIVYNETIRQISIKYDGVAEDVTIASETDKPGIYQRMDDAEDSLTLLEVR